MHIRLLAALIKEDEMNQVHFCASDQKDNWHLSSYAGSQDPMGWPETLRRYVGSYHGNHETGELMEVLNKPEYPFVEVEDTITVCRQ